MKRVLATIFLMLILFNVCSCSSEQSQSEITGKDTKLASRNEVAIELQKNVFIGEVLAVEEKDALIPKYNIDLTKYTVYTVNITESLDGHTPLGECLVYCVGTSEEFMSRISLKKGESYILDAEPWVYEDKIIYLLSIYTTAYPRIDAAKRVTLATSDTEAVDCGTLEEYKQNFYDAKAQYETAHPEFFKQQNVIARYVEIFKNIKTVNDANWFRDFDYAFKPDDKFIQKTRAHTDKVYSKFTALKTVDEIKNILKGE